MEQPVPPEGHVWARDLPREIQGLGQGRDVHGTGCSAGRPGLGQGFAAYALKTKRIPYCVLFRKVVSRGDFYNGNTEVFLMEISWDGRLNQRVLLQEWYDVATQRARPHTMDDTNLP